MTKKMRRLKWITKATRHVRYTWQNDKILSSVLQLNGKREGNSFIKYCIAIILKYVFTIDS